MIRLGIDTGGTYTDAVLLDDAGEVLAAAKAPTTRDDLARGIGAAVRRVIDDLARDPIRGVGPDGIGLVGLSTTLATNAVVEGRGGRVGLLLTGFDARSMDRAGLRAALAGGPWAVLAGGHDAHGLEHQPLDETAAAESIREMSHAVDAFAVTARFAVRNPAHELRLAEMVRDLSALPCTMSHELSARLDAPRRAVTTVLNARLVALVTRLLEAAHGLMRELAIDAPLMVVRGDGSLMRADLARLRPVETILSGPAASVVGAAALAGIPDALVADVGGTTTDMALLEAGRPRLDPKGALVGGHRTMVEAIELRTLGLGGDSATGRDSRNRLTLGPGRDLPLSLLAHDVPDVVAVLHRQQQRTRASIHDGRFAVLVQHPPGIDGRSRERLLALLASGPVDLETLIEREHLERPLRRLVERGHALLAGFTPSDAAHCAGLQHTWSHDAARIGAELEARKGWMDAASGTQHRADPDAFVEAVLALARKLTARALATTACSEDDEVWLDAPAVDAALDGRDDPAALLGVALKLARPVVAVGGPARIFYPQAVARLGTELVLPPHFDVCNAIGAVTGDVVRRQEAVILQVTENRYAVQLGDDRIESDDLAMVTEHTRRHLQATVVEAFRLAGGADADVTLVATDRKAVLDGGRSYLAERRVVATARGRPAPPSVRREER